MSSSNRSCRVKESILRGARKRLGKGDNSEVRIRSMKRNSVIIWAGLSLALGVSIGYVLYQKY